MRDATRTALINSTQLYTGFAPLQFLLVAVAGWINQHQREVIEYLQTENRVLREQLGARRLRFTDDQRFRLAAKAKRVGRRVLLQFHTSTSSCSSTFTGRCAAACRAMRP